MRTVYAEVNGFELKLSSKSGGVQGEKNVTVLQIKFDDSWSGLGKRIVWRDATGENPVPVVLFDPVGNDRDELRYATAIPAAALAYPGWCSFTIEGCTVRDGHWIKAMGAVGSLEVRASEVIFQPEDETPSQTEQILAALGETEQKVFETGQEAMESAVKAESWAVGGTDTREGEDTDNAMYYAQKAAEDAQSAKADAERSGKAAEDAETAESEAKNARDASVEAENAAQVAREGAENARNEAEALLNELDARAEGLPPESTATAEYERETRTVVFGIPKGDKGDQGPQGPKGEKGDKGDSWTPGIPIMIPGGWLRGDVNHDGIVNDTDAELVNQRNNKPIVGDMERQAADANGDGNLNTSDVTRIRNIAKGYISSTDLLGNWTPETDGDEKLYSVEIPVSGISDGDVVDVYIPIADAMQNCGTLKGECLDGILKVICKWPPTADTLAYVSPGCADHVRFVTDCLVPMGKMTRAFSVVVGTAMSGHTLNDCDYLCTGSHDQEVINAAIMSLTSTGGEVKLLAGTYNVEEGCIKLSASGTKLSGEGVSTVIAGKDDSYGTIIAVQNSNCTICDMKIAADLNLTSSCIGTENLGTGLTIENVWCLRGSSGFEDFSGSGMLTIKGCRFSGFTYAGIYVSCQQFNICGNNISGGTYSSDKHSIYLDVWSKNGIVSDNIMLGKDVTDEGTNNTVSNNIS